MSFHDDIANDIDNVFLNEDEFAESHLIDGNEMLASVDEFGLFARDRRSNSLERLFHKKNIVLYVSEKNFGKLPAVDRILILDGKRYVVKHAANESGVYAITLEVAHS